ncbi:hypothetical protein BGX26_007008, partial [Mortierella sp. AD094]
EISQDALDVVLTAFQHRSKDSGQDPKAASVIKSFGLDKLLQDVLYSAFAFQAESKRSRYIGSAILKVLHELDPYLYQPTINEGKMTKELKDRIGSSNANTNSQKNGIAKLIKV